jgi:predicted alpha/beta superfamily hydrolase
MAAASNDDPSQHRVRIRRNDVTKACKQLGLAWGLLCFASLAHAGFLGARSDSIPSSVLHQQRAIEVYLPEESKSTQQPPGRFETLYVLDGDWNTKLVLEVLDFMRQLRLMPPIIVVSVPNYIDAQGVNSRDRDLTPSAVDDEPRSGGAAQFLAFLKTELIPYVEQHYPASGTRLIHGHSYGGLFLMYVLENEPQLFDGYLVLDPAMRWDQTSFKAALRDRLTSIPAHGKALYIAGRAGVGAKDMGLDDLEPILRAGLPPALHWRMKLYEHETHDSLKLKATYDALRFAYAGYTEHPLEIAPADGIVLKGRPVHLFLPGDPFSIHYTTDGSEPTAGSPEYKGGPITVSDPGTVRVRLLSTRGVFDRDIPVRLRLGAALAPASGHRPGGGGTDWRYALFQEQSWPSLETRALPKPLREGTTSKDLALKDPGRERVAGRIARNLVIPADGYFVFAVRADQARLRLGNTLLISKDATDEQGVRSFIVPLEQGTYQLSFDFVAATSNPSLWLAVFRCPDDQPEWWTQRPWAELSGH